MALVGDNGAGKSTLIKGVAGMYGYDEGEIYFDGKRVTINSPSDSAALGIEVVYQDLALADNLDVVANMFLGRERTKAPWRLDEPSMEIACVETLNCLSVSTLRSVRQKVAGRFPGRRPAMGATKIQTSYSPPVIPARPNPRPGLALTL